MSATSELMRERIEALTGMIAEAKDKNDSIVVSLEEERKSLIKKLTEMSERSGQILTDSPMSRENVLKG